MGREGLQFKGSVAVGDKQEWPRWIPTLDMQKREPKHYGQYKDGMPGGPKNPLGARAIYLYDGRTDTHLRIHGTNQPQTIGTSASNGCFRMINEHVMDLYRRVARRHQGGHSLKPPTGLEKAGTRRPFLLVPGFCRRCVENRAASVFSLAQSPVRR